MIGEQLSYPERLSGGWVGLTIGIAGALFGGLGVAVAAQNAMNVAWSVPRNQRPDPISRPAARDGAAADGGHRAVRSDRALPHRGADQHRSLAEPRADARSDHAELGVFAVVFMYAPARSLGFLDVLPGAVAAAVMWLMLAGFRHPIRLHGGTERVGDQLDLRRRARHARAALPGVEHRRGVRRGERRAGATAVPALAADTVHRERRTHQGRSPLLHPAGAGAAATRTSRTSRSPSTSGRDPRPSRQARPPVQVATAQMTRMSRAMTRIAHTG